MSNQPNFDPLNATPEEESDMVAGYLIAWRNEPRPGITSAAWDHGYRNGRSDRTGFTDDDQLALAKRYVAMNRRGARPAGYGRIG